MNSKYYTPTLSDFAVGLQYEFRPSEDSPWQKRVLVDSIQSGVIELSTYRLCEKYFRIKLLDQVDIEDCGFKHNGIGSLQGKEHTIWVRETKDENVEFALFWSPGMISIDIRDPKKPYYGSQIFRGCIKNKCELQRLKGQLGIL